MQYFLKKVRVLSDIFLSFSSLLWFLQLMLALRNLSLLTLPTTVQLYLIAYTVGYVCLDQLLIQYYFPQLKSLNTPKRQFIALLGYYSLVFIGIFTLLELQFQVSHLFNLSVMGGAMIFLVAAWGVAYSNFPAIFDEKKISRRVMMSQWVSNALGLFASGCYLSMLLLGMGFDWAAWILSPILLGAFVVRFHENLKVTRGQYDAALNVQHWRPQFTLRSGVSMLLSTAVTIGGFLGLKALINELSLGGAVLTWSPVMIVSMGLLSIMFGVLAPLYLGSTTNHQRGTVISLLTGCFFSCLTVFFIEEAMLDIFLQFPLGVMGSSILMMAASMILCVCVGLILLGSHQHIVLKLKGNVTRSNVMDQQAPFWEDQLDDRALCDSDCLKLSVSSHRS